MKNRPGIWSRPGAEPCFQDGCRFWNVKIKHVLHYCKKYVDLNWNRIGEGYLGESYIGNLCKKMEKFWFLALEYFRKKVKRRYFSTNCLKRSERLTIYQSTRCLERNWEDISKRHSGTHFGKSCFLDFFLLSRVSFCRKQIENYLIYNTPCQNVYLSALLRYKPVSSS